jgi:uncharacterized protein (TIGR01777 family)
MVKTGKQRILVSGASGLVGSTIVPLLMDQGHSVSRLVRSKSHGVDNSASLIRKIPWDPAKGISDPKSIEGIDAVIHLAGESVAGLWTKRKKRRIRESRVMSTRSLAENLARMSRPPRVLVCASAIGYYGDRGSEILDESSMAGTGFLAETCQAWEAATHPAREAGIRVVNTRFAIVLSRKGGALASMLPVFRAGLGGKLGSGAQYFSWVSLDDVVGAIDLALIDDRLIGPLNVVAPQAVTNRELTQTLGRVLQRPTFCNIPAFVLKMAPGGLGREALLASERVVPARLQKLGYEFKFTDLESTLRFEIHRLRTSGK